MRRKGSLYFVEREAISCERKEQKAVDTIQ